MIKVDVLVANKSWKKYITNPDVYLKNRLKKAGYFTTKGKFGSFKKSVKKSKKPCKKGSKRKVVYCIKSKKKK